MPHYILGIDGGGTSCRAAVAGVDGRILGRGKSGAANILTDPDNALLHIVGAAKAAFEEAGHRRLTLDVRATVAGSGNGTGVQPPHDNVSVKPPSR